MGTLIRDFAQHQQKAKTVLLDLLLIDKQKDLCIFLKKKSLKESKCKGITIKY